MSAQMKDAVSMLKHQNKSIKDTVKTLGRTKINDVVHC